jgi:hypothetical protein
VKRVHVLERPMSVGDIDSLDMDEFDNDQAQQRVERVRLRKWRKLKQQAA